MYTAFEKKERKTNKKKNWIYYFQRVLTVLTQHLCLTSVASGARFYSRRILICSETSELVPGLMRRVYLNCWFLVC